MRCSFRARVASHCNNEQKNRDAQFAPKNGQKPKPSGEPAARPSAQEGVTRSRGKGPARSLGCGGMNQPLSTGNSGSLMS
jgi:hypothetical protein